MPTLDLPELENAGLGFQMLDEGTYTGKLEKLPEEKIDEKTEKPFLEVYWKIVSGPQQGQADETGSKDPVGREHRDRVYLTGPALWRLNRILVGLGMKKKEDKIRTVPLEAMLGHTIQFKLTRTINSETKKEYRNAEYII